MSCSSYVFFWPDVGLAGIDKQLHRKKGDVLPALSFSLLFRFQGAVARATLTLAGVGVAFGDVSPSEAGANIIRRLR